MIDLSWHDYSYYPYERELAAREAAALLDGATSETASGLRITGATENAPADRLTYFATVAREDASSRTEQSLLEKTASVGRRQATRYSVHGLHEYKGKFNPQVARALMNVLGLREGTRLLDPFCGSGTTLVEAAQLGISATGTDLNPLAVHVANAKLLAQRTPVPKLRSAFEAVRRALDREAVRPVDVDDERTAYLRKWFTEQTLEDLEAIRRTISSEAGSLAPVFQTIASDLLREHSLQDPDDLRIRRRAAAPPDGLVIDRFIAECGRRLDRIAAAQGVVGTTDVAARALLHAAVDLDPARTIPFDAAITSPPYAMALPYIDTQRLSLVWLGMVRAGGILALEGTLIGSREMRRAERRGTSVALMENDAGLPREEADLCRTLQRSLGASDGFRRQAVPALLYRYFAGMAEALGAVRRLLREHGRFALVVGHNHTVIDGTRFDIDTPAHLANLARGRGWAVDEVMPLQTYRRYGYHAGNAVAAESLIFLSAA